MNTDTDNKTASAPETRTYPKITLALRNPIHGFWDGGAKSRFTFEARECQDERGPFLKWGSWEMNFWRTTDGIGRSPKDAAGRMVRWMKRNIRHEGATITVNP